MIEIILSKKTTITEANKYSLEMTILPATVGVDKNLFVYKTSGASVVFDHVASVYDVENTPLTQVVGNVYHRLDNVALLFDSAFDEAEVEARLLADLVALERNLTSIEGQFSTDQTLKITEGAVVNIS